MVHEQHKSHLYLWKELKYPVWRNNPTNPRAFAHGKEQLWTAGETAGLQREPQNVNMHVNVNDEGRREYNVFNIGGKGDCSSDVHQIPDLSRRPC